MVHKSADPVHSSPTVGPTTRRGQSGFLGLGLLLVVGGLAAVLALRQGSVPPPTQDVVVIDQQALAFLNKLSGRLSIQLSEKPQRLAPGLQNEAAPPSAQIRSLHLTMEVFENEAFRDLTPGELARIVFTAPRVVIRGAADAPVAHDAPNGQSFTVRDLWEAIEETERKTRGRTSWFGGIDVHHVYFQGIRPRDDGSWSVSWGS